MLGKPTYLGDPSHQHGAADRLGVLLVNLGTPDGSDPSSVRRFLADFLGDPRVIEAPRWLWWLALHGVILRIRPSKSAHAYQQIWTPQGSPLLTHSTALTQRVAEALASQWNAAVALGMTYGSPSIPKAVEELRRQGVRQLVVLPLYPQYSGSTTASVFERVTKELQRWRWVPELRFIGDYHDDPGYIDAIAASIERHWRTNERRHLLFSFHGVPQRYAAAGDPYQYHCTQTARLIAQRLSLGEKDWTLSYQSQVGREEWLRPYTDETLLEFGRSGPKRVTVVCPGFATDCLETLEEIALRNREAFLGAGGEGYDYIPALNADESHVAVITNLVNRHAQGWQPASRGSAPAEQPTLRSGAQV
ncbi:ferrochelatase [Steroidobacter sp. S1-65]|uniref:Ferrochelatase n=1 Tax=Steroidobacter gossypii TaxID=2805490 RepID=A0ABS1WU23_9GAMM|nr:ferrochelatase [Steroidobacter gossypii]MBM0104473.1 ferrochelatase [Steroidobacter gossypii]